MSVARLRRFVIVVFSAVCELSYFLPFLLTYLLTYSVILLLLHTHLYLKYFKIVRDAVPDSLVGQAREKTKYAVSDGMEEAAEVGEGWHHWL